MILRVSSLVFTAHCLPSRAKLRGDVADKESTDLLLDNVDDDDAASLRIAALLWSTGHLSAFSGS